MSKINPGRIVHFEGTTNFRDLGGYVNNQGREIKWGLVYRAGKLDNLTAIDQEIFNALEIKTVVDFRRHDEVATSPNNLLKTPSLTYIHLPIVSGVNGISIIEDVIKKERSTQDIDGDQLMRKANKYYVSKAKEQCARFLSLLQNKENLPLVFHCSAGKDRTGYAAAMLLFALGLSRETILEDYLLSNECRKDSNQAKLASLNDNPIAKNLVKSLLEVKRDYLDSAYEEIDSLYGSLRKYLEQGLQLGDKELELLRSNLLE